MTTITTVSKDAGDVIFLNREDGSINFTRNWERYTSGFGDLKGEFWLGLEKIHQITCTRLYSLQVDFSDFNGNSFRSNYNSFSVGPESGGYILSVAGYDTSSTGGDSLINNKYRSNNNINDMKFSTIDVDNDRHSSYNCASGSGGGGWWFNMRSFALPTGNYRTGGRVTWSGIHWYSAKESWYSYKNMRLTLIPTFI